MPEREAPPRSFRGLMEALGDAGPHLIDRMLERFDWTGVSPRQLYHIILDRAPESARLALPQSAYSPLNFARFMLASPEFHGRVTPQLLRAFPEKRRLLVAHIPKCAGSDFAHHLGKSHPVLNPLGMGSSDVAFALRNIRSDIIAVSGHVGVDWYLHNHLYRFQDKIVTIVRHPHDLLLSHANYVLRRLRHSPESPDTLGWAAALGGPPVGPDLTEAAALELAGRCFEMFSEPNILCRFLGGHRNAAAAFELLARIDIEITDMAHYEPWLAENWGIHHSPRTNASPQVLRMDNLTAAQRAFLHDNTAEDVRLFEAIATRIERRGGNSITGPELVAGL